MRLRDAGSSLLAETLCRREGFSIALGGVFQNLGYALINSGNISYVQDARRFLSCALSVCEHMMDANPDNAEQQHDELVRLATVDGSIIENSSSASTRSFSPNWGSASIATHRSPKRRTRMAKGRKADDYVK